MRRILMLIVVALVMAAMMVAMAMPAVAKNPTNRGQCHKALNQDDVPPTFAPPYEDVRSNNEVPKDLVCSFPK